MTTTSVAAPQRTWPRLLLALGSLLVVAACLRPALTSVGPVLEQIGATTGLSAPALGLLGALPLLGFALFSPFVHGPAARWGFERLVLVALVVLGAGIVIRSLPPVTALWAGTAMIGAAVAVGNVLVPALVRRDHPERIALFTGISTAVMNTAAALAAGLSFPLAAAVGSWRPALGVWAGLVAAAVLVWAARMRWAPTPKAPAPTQASSTVSEALRPVWRSAKAWQVTLFMGLQSTTYFTLITWLPTVQVSRGVSADVAGWNLFAFQVSGIVGGLAITALMGRRDEQRPACLIVSLAMLTAMAGLLWAPAWSAVWVPLAGAATGSAIVVALALIGLRSRTSQESVRLSGMAQAIGYLLAACGPVAAGALNRITGSWDSVLFMVGALALVQATVALWAGQTRRDHPEPPGPTPATSGTPTGRPGP